MGCGGWLATVIVAMAVEFVGGRLFVGKKITVRKERVCSWGSTHSTFLGYCHILSPGVPLRL